MPPCGLAKAASILRAGGIVAYPTESVYGLGCDPCNRSAVMRLLRIKRRIASKGLIVIAARLDQLTPFVAEFPEHVLDTWPGAYTWLLQPRRRLPYWITGRHARIAMRLTAHTTARALCLAAGMALISTSANRTGLAPVRDYREAVRRFGGEVDCVVAGRVGGYKQPTSIRDAASGKIIRPG